LGYWQWGVLIGSSEVPVSNKKKKTRIEEKKEKKI